MPRAPDPEERDSATRAVTASLLGASKYGALSPDVLERTAAWAVERHPRRGDAEKAARRKLHQIHAAFVTERQLKDAAKRLAALADGSSERDVEQTCRAILRSHASTAEREPYVESFYEAIFGDVARASRVVDLAAGLNPFAIPWMGLTAATAYEARDIDQRFATLATRLADHVEVDLVALTGDLITATEPVIADVVLLLKALPTLEQQRRGAAREVLERVDADLVAVSLPARSLGGRAKGMPESYERLLDEALPDRWERSERLRFPTETLYLLRPPASGSGGGPPCAGMATD
jgi:16S rRNA (guanine(1405)-N(7))-methyltransferase